LTALEISITEGRRNWSSVEPCFTELGA